VWDRDTIATTEAAVASAEEGGSRGALLGLKRAWPTSVGCGHCRTKVEEKGVLRQGRKMAPSVLLQRERWLPAGRNPL